MTTLGTGTTMAP